MKKRVFLQDYNKTKTEAMQPVRIPTNTMRNPYNITLSSLLLLILMLCSISTEGQPIYKVRHDTICQGDVGFHVYMDTLLYETFDNGLPSCWTSIAGASNNGIDAAERMYPRGGITDYFLPFEGLKSAFESDADLGRGAMSLLITPAISVYDPAHTTISFHFMAPATRSISINDTYDIYGNEYHDTIITEIYDECALAYANNNSGSYNPSLLWHINYDGDHLVNYNDWTSASESLSNTPSGAMHYVFIHYDEGSAGFGLDNVLIYGTRQVLIPSNVSAAAGGTTIVTQQTYNENSDCPTIVTTYWYIKPRTSSRETVNINSDELDYTWHGHTFESAGEHTIENLSNSQGCDSTATLVIIVAGDDTNRIEHHACDYYDWEGLHLTADTVIDKTLTSVLTGTDSIVKLTLTLGHSSAETLIDTHLCSSFYWIEAGETTFNNATLQHTFENTEMCDSVVTLHVTIGTPSYKTISHEQCDSYHWDLEDMDYTKSNRYSHLLSTPNTTGCDSTIVLNLTINHSRVVRLEETACDTFYWNATDSIYRLSATDTAHSTTTEGCDSTTILQLHLRHTTKADTLYRDACDSILWLTKTLYNSDIYHDTITNTSGCDSLVWLSLTIRHSTMSDTASAHACDSFFWTQRNERYILSGLYKDTSINGVGCDSITFLSLKLSYKQYAPTRSYSACGRFEWTTTGRVLETTGIYSDTITTTAGCDSVITIDLVIHEVPQLTLSADTTIAICGSATMTANGAQYIQWGGNALTREEPLLTGPTATIGLQPRNNVMLTAMGYTIGEETIINGDFSDGNTGFSSNLVYNTTLNAYGTYAVANYARGVHSSFIGKDHTTPTLNTGNFMIIDGKDQANTMIWSQTTELMPYTNYLFSMWGTSVTNSSPAQLQVYINGTAVGSVFTVPTPATDQGNWGQHYFVWNSGNSLQGEIRIVNQNGAGSGNDFGIDDISLRPLLCGVERRANINVHIDTTHQFVCDAYTWRENHLTYTESGTYEATIRNAAGCDSLRVLDLTVANNYIDTTAATVCQRFYWSIADTIIEESGLYQYTIDNGDSICDTTLYLRLTIVDCNEPLPDNVNDPWCFTQPPANAFDLQELFHCNNINAMSTPMVGDVDGDGVPEIIGCRYLRHSCYESVATGLLVFDGTNGNLKYTIEVPTYSISGQCMSLCDADRNRRAELYIIAEDNHLYCFDATGTGQIWRSDVRLNARYLVMSVDLNGDGRVEIVCGPYVFDALTGTLLLQGTLTPNGRGHGSYASCWGRVWNMQAIADIDLDGQMEICAGDAIYRAEITNNGGTDGNTWTLVRQLTNTTGIQQVDGQTFLVDFDNDGDIDVCVIGAGNGRVDVYVWEGQTTDIIGHYGFGSGYTWGGSMSPSIPFSGDLDGNGTAEIIFNMVDGMRTYTYDPTVAGNMRQMHFASQFGETAGFTVFDFNQDGREEIVYRNVNQMYIVDGTTLANLCPSIAVSSGTVVEYPTVADVNGDGHAEIIVCRNFDASGGVVSVYGSQQRGAWGSARKVWNQWAYNSVCINEDLTVPERQFNVATIFPNGKKPFNGFLRQMPYIDHNGDLYLNTPDIDVSGRDYNVTYTDSGAVIAATYCNFGETPLEAPFAITIYENDYKGRIIKTDTIDTIAEPGFCISQGLEIPMRVLCHLTCDSIAVAINDNGDGIAQNGNQQAECDTTNNVVRVPLQAFVPKADTLVVAQCDSFHWNAIDTTLIANSFVTDTLPDMLGCDSVRCLKLTIYPSYYDTLDTLACDHYIWPVTGESFTHSANTTQRYQSVHYCDSIHHLALEMHYRYDTTDNVHACQRYTWEVDHRTYDRTTTHTETMLTQYGCDSIRTLVVTVYHPYYDTVYDTICQGQTRTFGGITLHEEGHYQHKVAMMSDCDSIHDLFLTIRPLKPLEVTWTSQCELLQYTVTARNPETDTIDNYFVWESFPPDEEANAQSRQQTIVVHPSLATIYTAVSAYDNGLACPHKVSISLMPTQPVEGYIRLSTNILTPELKEFRATAEGKGFHSQQWHIDGEQYSNNATISYTYDPESSTDSVRIHLQVSNGYCSDSDSVVLHYFVGELFVPNFFAPSEERVGTFKVNGIGILDYEIHIYDRRGLLVFETTDIHESWNGILPSGAKAPQNAYVYTIRYRTAIAPDEWRIKTGTVVLVR